MPVTTIAWNAEGSQECGREKRCDSLGGSQECGTADRKRGWKPRQRTQFSGYKTRAFQNGLSPRLRDAHTKAPRSRECGDAFWQHASVRVGVRRSQLGAHFFNIFEPYLDRGRQSAAPLDDGAAALRYRGFGKDSPKSRSRVAMAGSQISLCKTGHRSLEQFAELFAEVRPESVKDAEIYTRQTNTVFWADTTRVYYWALRIERTRAAADPRDPLGSTTRRTQMRPQHTAREEPSNACPNHSCLAPLIFAKHSF